MDEHMERQPHSFYSKNAEAPEHIIREENGIGSLFLPSVICCLSEVKRQG